ncbi:MAG: M16 family metallopeptidase [cyanobacterium endosymbiont of Rhopalodia musculus]|uniref:M16 family metallopeptidase n=1 Tax=cyanobacterium endosymbiont of Epithemia clementina EcSB TaxID=3034674 RepID=UPI002480613B|nr:pitrilysin family protein [cyanobacterium endosymbiont of Epithemia clementina EcSB]WGT67271.1 pitrilysin family protein [cyanobacterium endosymbiont of Epithemia clementina EcSB]
MTSTLLKTSAFNAPTIRSLPNGLTIIAEQMPVESISLNLWLKIGSALESNEINGMAHFLEHMVFKGTSCLKSGEFERLVEERGALTNAATSQDYTHYHINCVPQDFRDLTPLQLDVVFNPSIADEEFERERLVVLEEIRRSNDNPRLQTFYRAMETCFEVLPYRRRVLGKASIIEGLMAQQMRDFHETWYQPESVTAVTVGNLPVETLIDIVAKSFSQTCRSSSIKQKNAQEKKAVKFLPEVPFTKIVRREFEDSSLQQSRLIMIWRVPGLIELDRIYALDVLAVILGQGRVSRLFRDLREDKKLVSRINVSNMTHKIQGMFYISAQLLSENILEVEQIIIEQITHIRQTSVTETELNRVRIQVANRFVFSSESPSNRANLYGYFYSQLQDLESALTYPSRIQHLSLEDIQQAALDYLSPNAYGITIVRSTNK